MIEWRECKDEGDNNDSLHTVFVHCMWATQVILDSYYKDEGATTSDANRILGS